MPTSRDLDAELDTRLQRFAASGMSRAGMLAQLTLAGYPTELLRQRFPEMPDVAFGLTKPSTPQTDVEPQGRASATALHVQQSPARQGVRSEVSSRAVSRQGESHRDERT